MINEEELEVVMHRDVHFGGSWAIMQEYYANEGKGALLDRRLVQRAVDHPLSDEDRAKVERSIEAYQQLRGIYEVEEETSPIPRLIADLILSEDEDEEKAIEAVVALGERIVPELIQLLRSDEAADPLFPGYGFATELAARSLGRIGSPDAIIPLFETDGEEAIMALVRIGEPAKVFLLKILKSKPITEDTERAAAAIGAFPPDEEIRKTCAELLLEVRQEPLRSYLAIASDSSMS